MKNQSGFTLIELVVVFVILGILAATAIPRFADVTAQSRTAVADGIIGSLQSAAVIRFAAGTPGAPGTGAEIVGDIACDTDEAVTITIAGGGGAAVCDGQFLSANGSAAFTGAGTCTGPSADVIAVTVGTEPNTGTRRIPAGLCSG